MPQMPVGQIGFVTSDPKRFQSVSITNDVGGTTFLPRGTYRVRVTRSFMDYETGVVVHGVLLDEKDIAKARKVGTTGYKPSDYRKYVKTNPDLYRNAVKAAKNFDPTKVYFHASQFEPESSFETQAPQLPTSRRRVRGFTITGNAERAVVRRGRTVLEEFSNRTTTSTKPNAFDRAVAFAQTA